MIGLVITVAGIVIALIGVAGSFYAALAQAKASRVQEAQWREEMVRWQADAEARLARTVRNAMHQEAAQRPQPHREEGNV